MIHGVMGFIDLPRPPASSHVSTHAPTCTHTRTNIYMYQRIPTHTCTNMYIYTYQHIHVHAHQHKHVHVPIYTCTNIYQQAHVPPYTYTHTNITHINPTMHHQVLSINGTQMLSQHSYSNAVTVFETNLHSQEFHHYIHST